VVGTETVKVLIVAPNQVVRAGVRTLLEDQVRIEVAGAVSTVAEAAPAIRRDPLDVVLVDTGLGGGVANVLRARRPPVRVVALVTGEVPPVPKLRDYVTVGVDGIVSTAEDIGSALVAIRAGRAPGGWISPTLGADILRGVPVYEPPARDVRGESVTPSEHAVLKLVADGHTDREIASRLHRSERVVKYHVSNLLSKLQARNRAHVVKLAIRSGLLSIPVRMDRYGLSERHGIPCDTSD
jgi:DNA-binding NarL/FixJ family response regulator